MVRSCLSAACSSVPSPACSRSRSLRLGRAAGSGRDQLRGAAGGASGPAPGPRTRRCEPRDAAHDRPARRHRRHGRRARRPVGVRSRRPSERARDVRAARTRRVHSGDRRAVHEVPREPAGCQPTPTPLEAGPCCSSRWWRSRSWRLSLRLESVAGFSSGWVHGTPRSSPPRRSRAARRHTGAAAGGQRTAAGFPADVHAASVWRRSRSARRRGPSSIGLGFGIFAERLLAPVSTRHATVAVTT